MQTDPSPLRTADSSLRGKWVSACGIHPLKTSVYLKETLEFQEGRVHRIQWVALDRHCARILYQQETESTTTLSARGVYSETREGVTLLPLGSVGRELFNQGGVCGVKDWEASIPQSFDDPAVCGVSRVVNGKFQVNDQSGRQRLTLESCEYVPSRNCYTLTYDKSLR